MSGRSSWFGRWRKRASEASEELAGWWIVSREILWESPDGLIKRHFGHVTASEVLKGNELVEADSRFDALRYVINDFTGCTSLDTTPLEVEAIAAIDRAASVSNRGIRIAIVATHPDVLAASIAYASSPCNVFETRIFPSVAEARAWLSQVSCR